MLESKKSKKQILSKGQHDAIIDEKLFEEVKLKIGKNVRHTVVQRSSYLLSGLVFCDKCGARMYGHTYMRGPHSYYRCNGFISKGRCQCPGNSINTKFIDVAVESELKGFSFNREAFKKVAEQASAKKPRTAGASLAEKQIAEIKRQKERLLDVYQDGSISKGSYLERVKVLDQHIELLNEELSRQNDNGTQVDDFDLDAVLNLCSDLSDIYTELETPDRAEFLRNLIQEVRINEDHFDFSINIPPKLFSRNGPLVYQKKRTDRGSWH